VVARRAGWVAAAGVTLETTHYDLGGWRYLATGQVLPDEVLEELTGLRGLACRRRDQR